VKSVTRSRTQKFPAAIYVLWALVQVLLQTDIETGEEIGQMEPAGVGTPEVGSAGPAGPVVPGGVGGAGAPPA
jgi:hypothetical protein